MIMSQMTVMSERISKLICQNPVRLTLLHTGKLHNELRLEPNPTGRACNDVKLQIRLTTVLSSHSRDFTKSPLSSLPIYNLASFIPQSSANAYGLKW